MGTSDADGYREKLSLEKYSLSKIEQKNLAIARDKAMEVVLYSMVALNIKV